MPPVTPNADAFRPVSFDPSTVPYLNDEQRARIMQAQVEMAKVQREKMNQIRRATHAVVIKYTPSSVGFGPADISNMERDLPVSLGQLAQ